MKYLKPISFYAILAIVIIFMIYMLESEKPKSGESYGMYELSQDIENDQVVRIDIRKNRETPTGTAIVYLKDPKRLKLEIPVSDTGEFGKYLLENNIKYYEADITRDSILVQWLPYILMLGVTVILFMFIMGQAQGGASKIMSFGKSRAKKLGEDEKTVTFADVAGLEEEKVELAEIVDFLKNPKRFIDVGARIPKGFLLIGPPGTGKTLLAKAVAGEAKVPFFSISGSDFVEMYVGVGASRVRDLFAEAKKNSPCIVMIDEIDAVGRKRGAGLGGGHDEREQTLNQLLVEMDGFEPNEGVIVIAATNRADILDPALMRPGRFDRQVAVGRPDIKGREEILKIHSRNKPLSDNVDLKEVARTTAGFTGADLENLINEAAIHAARDGNKIIEQKYLRDAFIKVGIGTEKRSRVISEEERRITAYHEAGHAIIMQTIKEIDSVHSISIIPTGFAGGYTMQLPKQDAMYLTKTKMQKEIVALLGGRAAEQVIFNEITTGASNDIERATAIARNMVVKYGMSDKIGPIQLGEESDEVFIGRDWGHKRNYGEEVATTIDNEVREIINASYQEAIGILKEYEDVLHKTAEILLEKEKIVRSEFISLFGDRLPKEILDHEAEIYGKEADYEDQDYDKLVKEGKVSKDLKPDEEVGD